MNRDHLPRINPLLFWTVVLFLAVTAFAFLAEPLFRIDVL
jgi:hypothetical protein